MRFAPLVQFSGGMGLPLRIAVPIFVVLAGLFLAVMTYFVREGLGNAAAPLGQSAVATPIPAITQPPGAFTLPQSGTGPVRNPSALPGTNVGK